MPQLYLAYDKARRPIMITKYIAISLQPEYTKVINLFTAQAPFHTVQIQQSYKRRYYR